MVVGFVIMPMWISRNWSKVEPFGGMSGSPPASAQWAGCNWRWKPTRPGHQFVSETPHFFKEKVCISNRHAIHGWCLQTMFKSYLSFLLMFFPPSSEKDPMSSSSHINQECVFSQHTTSVSKCEPTLPLNRSQYLRRWCSSRPRMINAERVGELLHHALASVLSKKKSIYDLRISTYSMKQSGLDIQDRAPEDASSVCFHHPSFFFKFEFPVCNAQSIWRLR